MEVQAGALRRNLNTIRERVGSGVGLIPMVKADGYGLGVRRTVGTLEPLGPLGYGVATVEEGQRLREEGVERPVLVLSPVPGGSLARAVESGLTVAISDVGSLQRLQEVATPRGEEASFHLDVDTGMGRSGLDWRRVEEWGESVVALASSESLRWTGCFTHFHSADERDTASVRSQWDRFRDVVTALDPPEGVLLHGCNSAAALRLPELAAGAVRPGVFLYGGRAGADLPAPEPVVSVRARVVHVKDAPPGSTVGYGATHVARSWERWATVALGYGDGLPRLLGNRGRVLVRGRSAPIVGRISMDVTVVDISDLDEVEVGDVATIIGRDGAETIELEDVAGWAETISYEILTGFTRRIPRIWMDDGRG
ncbi:MAG: alanine racemase [Longimicrobiales bacterium]|nr:alanine racemase [Longimicrobiales bacterium]